MEKKKQNTTTKIHYVGEETIQELHVGASMEDAMYHLGAKYGGEEYNRKVKNGEITFDEENNIVEVK